MKNLLSVLFAVTIYFHNGDVVHIERNWLVNVKVWSMYTEPYIEYTIEDQIHKVPMRSIFEIVETPYKEDNNE